MLMIVAPLRPMTIPTWLPSSISAVCISSSLSSMASCNPAVLPNRFRAQNLVCRSFEPLASMWPAGCHCRSQIAMSCAYGTRAAGSSLPFAPRFQNRSVPSMAPEANTLSCSGCHATLVTSLWWPLRLASSFIARMSYSLMSWSRLAVTSQFPLLFQATFVTVFLCPYRVDKHDPALGSQSFTKLSLLPLAMTLDRGCHWIVLTSHPCPSRTRSSVCVAQSHTRTFESSPHETNLVSLGEKLNAWMAWPLCESIDWTGAIEGDQYLIFPPASLVNR
mmetsp:Transcript_91620/g.186429  ORF Transcript_91620/g.186429 Transcript_91620/m.186429 type:complete len:276 (-) Transcript_91620:522-1349(-)